MSMMINPSRFEEDGPAGPGAHRYWRMTQMRNNAGNTLGWSAGIAEIHLRSTVGGSNLAATVNTDAGTFSGSNIARANDGDANTYWAGGSNTIYPSIQFVFDLGSPQDVAEMTQTARNDFGGGGNQAIKAFRLEYSDDNVSYTIAQTTCQFASNFTPGSTQTLTFDFVV